MEAMTTKIPEEVRLAKKLAVAKAGGPLALGRTLGISRQAVEGWNQIPAERVHEVERATGLPRSIIRPDLYPAEREPGPHHGAPCCQTPAASPAQS